ncbi:hypothetical protein SPRG_16679 [Saprolegnia parasitica CBS 223.65]|uniref:Uncharacterized protein n=1 Tax=Saprolegnia parasitica (strain CBS 223.65) TaxID=695850 RepID=A0A067BMF1_SAPPC|nr:hypothetical protein SPRG_16679 [Saprolegnia parasitica CBS 223.65]KDO17920.1 hypothetical protein SPRG_16679 [Saprolegnia parasitica CBS 223.65]|eukprot:XP_012211371.1 hypothetical protein SPRG_16679 [Saprolegnia parasitica CBS 223.65]
MSNPAIAAYEAAFKLLKEPSAFVTKGAHPHPAPVLFHLTAQIAALYPNKVISESDILFEERYLDDHDQMLCEINRVSLPHLGPSNGAFMDLSHMVVDDVGDADLFRLQPSEDDEANATTFGVLIVLLPSVHTGGVITFTYGNHSETFDEDTSLLETSFAAAFLTTTITSAPITSGRRVALVYRLYYGHVKTPMRMEPNVQDAAVAAFQELGQSTTHGVQRLGLELEVAHHPLSFEHFTYAELGFVNVLLAAGNFDVGVARLDAFKKGEVMTFLPHPACNIPDAVVDGVIGHTLQGFLHKPPPSSDAFECPSFVLVFWPTRHRVCIVDVVGVLDFLMRRRARGNDNDDGYLGISETRELLLGVMPFFGAHGPTLAKTKRMSPEEEIYMLMHKKDLPRNLSLLEKMQRLLTALVDDIAPVVHDLLTKHGWEALQSSMLRLVQRWIETDPDATMQLLMSLAGLNTESSVCPPLSQPFEAELFKRCYDVVLAKPGLFTETKGMLPRGPTSVKGLFLLEHYLTTTAAQLQDAHYASQRLPLSLVPAIDAFLFAYPSLDSLFCSSAEWHPLKDLAVGLASAVRCQPSLPLPSAIIDKVLAAMQAPMTPHARAVMASQQAEIAAAVLVLASLSQRLDAALFDILVHIYGPRLLPIVASIASQLPDDAIVKQLVVSYIDASVGTLVDESSYPEPFNSRTYTGRYMEETYKFGADIFVGAAELLLRFAPDTALAFASKWLQLLPTTLDDLHDRLVPVVPRLDRTSSVFRLLFSAMIDRFVAVSELLNIVNLAAPSPRHLDPDHCNQPDVCVDLARVVDANATRLCFVTGDDGKCRLEKVRQPNQVSPTEWDVHHAKMKIHARIAACIASLTSTVGGEPEDASNESTEPPAKRVRRS